MGSQFEKGLPPAMDRKIRILLSAGEVSGDMIAAHLADTLQAICPGVELSGVGGKRMEGAGVKVLLNTSHLGSVGITEPLATIPGLLRTFRCIRTHVRREKPDTAVLIGHEFFHLILARWLRANCVRTIAYFPPQVWLWKSLAKPIARSFDWILTSFMEEHRVYRQAGGRVIFVGHYLCDHLKEVSAEDRKAARRSEGLALSGKLVGLYPGSRLQEVNTLVPFLLDAAQRLVVKDPSIQFIVPVAESHLEGRIRERGLTKWVHLSRNSLTAMAACDVVILCSGTATLEAAMMGVPMIILYKVSRITWLTVEFLDLTGLIDSKTIGLPNLLSDKKVVPEMIQSEVTASRLSEEVWSILKDNHRKARMKEQLRLVKAQLGERGTTERAARIILKKAIECKILRSGHG